MNMWTEIRTAMMVARLGTVRAAANALGLHRATVSRHVDTLEAQLGTKLFIRHRNGYTPTQDGLELRKVADATDDLIDAFVRNTADSMQELAGTLTVSALTRSVSILAPAIRSFTEAHPKASVRYVAEARLASLEESQADMAIRVGSKPTHPDYVAIPFLQFPVGLYGHKSYFEEFGVPVHADDFVNHRFVAVELPNSRYDVVEFFDAPPKAISMITNDSIASLYGVLSGVGLGVISYPDAMSCDSLLEVLPREPRREIDMWVVTHVDMHRNPMVQEFIKHLRATRPESLPRALEGPKTKLAS